MPTWTESTDILAAVRKQWDSGRILRELTLGECSLFPMRIKLKGPVVAQIAEQFDETSKWIARLHAKSASVRGYGYELIEAERNLRGLGRNTLPTHALIPTVEDALQMLHKASDVKRSLAFSDAICGSFPEALERLRPWLARRALSLLDYSGDSARIITVLTWFKAHPNSGLYLRQLNIEGVDTKYIEHHRDIIANLLELILPPNAIVADVKKFEERFGLLSKPVTVRYRLLDPNLPHDLLTDIQTPVSQLAKIKPSVPIERVYITENEINGLAFPSVKNAMVIFGLGFGLEVLRELEWLTDLPVYYWGDLDTHGFAMLSQLRSFLPQTQSMLMDEQTLLDLRSLWDVERKQQTGDLPHLTDTEQHVYNLLRDNTHGTGVRLEQERIPFSTLELSLSLQP